MFVTVRRLLVAHHAVALEDRAFFDDQRGRVDVAVDLAVAVDLHALRGDDLADDRAADGDAADVDLAFDLRALADDQLVLVTILPLKRPSMRIVSSNSSSPRNDEPRSRKPFSSPLLFFISPPILPSPSHQFVDDANQFVFAAVADVDHSSSASAVDLDFGS